MRHDKPRIVIVGGGFGGIAAAKALRHCDAEVVVIDRRNHHIFQPLLYQVATAVLAPSEVAAPIRQLEKDGDGFIHNDARYGGIHNTDQSMMMPLYYKGELVCWLSSTIHEGENGSCEPGGMPAPRRASTTKASRCRPSRWSRILNLSAIS